MLSSLSGSGGGIRILDFFEVLLFVSSASVSEFALVIEVRVKIANNVNLKSGDFIRHSLGLGFEIYEECYGRNY